MSSLQLSDIQAKTSISTIPHYRGFALGWNACIAIRVRVWVRIICLERRSGDRTRVDGVCDFDKVLPDQLCPSRVLK